MLGNVFYSKERKLLSLIWTMEPIPLSLHQILLRVMRLSVRVLDPGLSIKSLVSQRLI